MLERPKKWKGNSGAQIAISANEILSLEQLMHTIASTIRNQWVNLFSVPRWSPLPASETPRFVLRQTIAESCDAFCEFVRLSVNNYVCLLNVIAVIMFWWILNAAIYISTGCNYLDPANLITHTTAKFSIWWPTFSILHSSYSAYNQHRWIKTCFFLLFSLFSPGALLMVPLPLPCHLWTAAPSGEPLNHH